MTVTCEKCGMTTSGKGKKLRVYLAAQGWACLVVQGCAVWRCGACQYGVTKGGNR